MTTLAGLISPTEAARLLEISEKTLRAHVDDGKIPRVIIGRGKVRKRFAFDPADIAAFMRTQKDFGAPLPCPSTRGKARPTTASTSRSQVFDFQALLEQRAAAKPKK